MATDVVPVKAGVPLVRDLIEKQRDQFARALPGQLSVDRFLRLVATEVRSTPRLAECTTVSLLGAVMNLAQLGLEPGGVLGHAWILPFKDGQSGQYEATFVLGYKGIIQLAYRSDRIAAIFARAVCVNDEFDHTYGLGEDRLTHRPRLDGPRGKPYAWYGLARFKGGGHYLEVIGADTVEEHRKRSKAPNSPAWKNDYSAMACKTVIKVMQPYLPLTAEVARAIERDEHVVHMTDDGEVFDPETGEIAPDDPPPGSPASDEPF